MEQILCLYTLLYDPLYPVVCFDERPCFLIGEAVEPLALQSGRVRKEHYAYERFESCALMLAIEPRTGTRLAQVYPQRTKREYTLCCQTLVAQYPEAIKICLVQDNLKTHDTSPFYENLPANEALALAERFEFYFAPKSASWLNMIEIEFSAFARLCLNRRAPIIEQLEREILALVNEHHAKHRKIVWQFSIQSARSKLSEKQTQLDQLRPVLYLYQQIQTNLTFIGKPMQSGTARDDPQITSLQSTLNLYQKLYLDLLNSITAVQLARVQSIPTVSQIEDAVIPERPVRPIPLLYIILAGLAGLFVAVGAILLIDYFDGTLKSSQKIQEVLGIPVIGEIPEVNPVHKVGKYSSANKISFSLLNALGILRINVSRLFTQKSPRTILITSPALGDGKTTIASNLAKAFVESGKKVASLDADLSNPTLHSRFELDNQRGLSNILSENLDWQDVARVISGTTLITSGVQSQSSAVLLESEKFTQLLKQIQKEVDVVIVDGPPLFTVDSQILASKVGGILLVVRQGGTLTAVARAMLDQLKLMNANVLGAVVNRVPLTDAYYFDGYSRNISEDKIEKIMEKIVTTKN
jgi:capsular exopolysaccharide synthesis family protein